MPALFPDLPESSRWLPLLRAHAAILDEAAPRVRTSAVEVDDWAHRHYAESLELLRLAGPVQEGARWVDVGSGGGFPGLVAAIVLPAVDVHLVEPLQKRARLLSEAAAALGLTNVNVYPLRAEDAGRGPLRETGDIVTARAVAELRELLEYTVPLARAAGRLLLPKGSGLDDEVRMSVAAMRQLGCELTSIVPFRPEISAYVRVAEVHRSGPLTSTYPRRPGMPAKRPL